MAFLGIWHFWIEFSYFFCDGSEVPITPLWKGRHLLTIDVALRQDIQSGPWARFGHEFRDFRQIEGQGGVIFFFFRNPCRNFD